MANKTNDPNNHDDCSRSHALPGSESRLRQTLEMLELTDDAAHFLGDDLVRLRDDIRNLLAERKRLLDGIKSAWITMDNIDDECAEIWQDEFQDIVFPNTEDRHGAEPTQKGTENQ